MMSIGSFLSQADGLARFLDSAVRDVEYTIARDPVLLLLAGMLLVVLALALLRVR
jgi:hypothetical protein